MAIASIDIGSNTVRLLIADLEPQMGGRGFPRLQILYEDKQITRLAENVGVTGRIGAGGIQRTLDAMSHFKKAIGRYSVEDIVCVGTSALREADNRGEIIMRIKQEAGFEVEVISGEEEARRTWLGVEQALGHIPNTLLVLDIGGGSTELIVKKLNEPVQLISTSLGVVNLTETYLKSDPITEVEILKLLAFIETTIRPVLSRLISTSEATVIGTAGTVTTLAAMELGMDPYDPAKVQNLRLTDSQAEHWFHKLSNLSLDERKQIVGLDPGREDVIIPGLAILLSVLRFARCREWIVSDAGLREGILVDWFLKQESK